MRAVRTALVLLALGLSITCSGEAEPARLLLGTTHTLQDSGILDELVRGFMTDHPAQRVSAVVAGSGEVLAMAARGDVDLVLSHSPADERAFVAAGHGREPFPAMYSDFVLLGPPGDPAGAGSAADLDDALRAIAGGAHLFVSRGDNSGTHRKEMTLWSDARTEPGTSGYIEAGTGMADALRLASQRGAYVLSERATFEALRSELQLRIMKEGDRRLLNQYSVILVTRARNDAGALLFSEWLRSPAARELITAFRAGSASRPLFQPGSPP